MDSFALCLCCLTRPSDKNLNTQYTIFEHAEVYADMLKECYEIQLNNGNESCNGICEVCVSRLRDAHNFKLQVIRCQKNLLNIIKDEERTKVKIEAFEIDNDNSEALYLELKDEVDDGIKSELDVDNLAAVLGLEGLKERRRSKGRTNTKRIRLEERKCDDKSRKTMKLSICSIDTRRSIKFTRKNTNQQHQANIDNLLKHSNCTPFANKNLSGYICAYCKETFQDPKDLRCHTQTEHRKERLIQKTSDKNNITIKIDITDLRCNFCNTSLEKISDLKQHLADEHNIKFYSDIHDYILEFKLTDTEMLDCCLCHSRYETFKMLLQHMNGHYRNYICDVCDLGFINKHKLMNHKRTHDVGTYKCSFCDKVFSTKIRKMCHEKYTHNSNSRYTTNCPHCDQTFTSYYQRNRHMSTEHNTSAASYKCNICERSFIMKSKLTSHIKKVHLMERNHICSECGQGFFVKHSLEEHMIKHNGERVHKCTVCHKAYARKKTLREHMRIHNNDRRFKCGVCSVAFVQKCSLKSHMLSNHGVTLSEFENTRDDVKSSPVT